jgi:hypothetical protein
MKSSFALMQELFVNEARNTGSTIIAASGGTQFARETGSGNNGNGIFTGAVLEFLEQPHGTISALKRYVNKRVTEKSGGLQVPASRGETGDFDWWIR